MSCLGTPEVSWSVGWGGTETSALLAEQNRQSRCCVVVGLSLSGLEQVKVGLGGLGGGFLTLLLCLVKHDLATS